jgi:hypothetical protein
MPPPQKAPLIKQVDLDAEAVTPISNVKFHEVAVQMALRIGSNITAPERMKKKILSYSVR